MNYIHSVEHVQRNPNDDARRREGGEGRRLKPEPIARNDVRSEREAKCLKTAEPAPHAVHEATPALSIRSSLAGGAGMHKGRAEAHERRERKRREVRPTESERRAGMP